MHLLAWCKDRSGIPFPSIANCSEEEIPKMRSEIEKIHSKIISCQLEEGEVDEDLEQQILKYQCHNCTFTCHKKKKTMTIKKEEGYGNSQVPSDATDLIALPLCRFDFPKNPSDVTVCLTSFRKGEDQEVISRAKKDFLKIRKYLLRQTYCPNGAKREDQPGYKKLQHQTFKEFLLVVGMFEGLDPTGEDSMKQARERYHNSLRVSIKGQLKVFGQRNMKSLFMNNFNKNLMKLQPANQDVSYIGDAYGAAGYVCGYLTKAESGQSALLKKCDEEFSGQPEHIKIKQMAKILDKSREISIQESVYRILGLPLCKFSVKVSCFIQGLKHYTMVKARSNGS